MAMARTGGDGRLGAALCGMVLLGALAAAGCGGGGGGRASGQSGVAPGAAASGSRGFEGGWRGTWTSTGTFGPQQGSIDLVILPTGEAYGVLDNTTTGYPGWLLGTVDARGRLDGTYEFPLQVHAVRGTLAPRGQRGLGGRAAIDGGTNHVDFQLLPAIVVATAGPPQTGIPGRWAGAWSSAGRPGPQSGTMDIVIRTDGVTYGVIHNATVGLSGVVRGFADELGAVTGVYIYPGESHALAGSVAVQPGGRLDAQVVIDGGPDHGSADLGRR